MPTRNTDRKVKGAMKGNIRVRVSAIIAETAIGLAADRGLAILSHMSTAETASGSSNSRAAIGVGALPAG
jgi:hypothetical protein